MSTLHDVSFHVRYLTAGQVRACAGHCDCGCIAARQWYMYMFMHSVHVHVPSTVDKTVSHMHLHTHQQLSHDKVHNVLMEDLAI